MSFCYDLQHLAVNNRKTILLHSQYLSLILNFKLDVVEYLNLTLLTRLKQEK